MEYNLGFRIAQKNSNHTDPQEGKKHKKLKMEETETCYQIMILMLLIWILSRIEINVEDENMHRSWGKFKTFEIFM